MGLTINSNLDALNASRNLNNTENMLAMSMQRLSSGLKINSAADDVAGYAISQTLQSQVNGLNQASENVQDAVALAQTAQGALNDINSMLQRVRELGVQYSNGTTSHEDQKAIISEVEQLVNEIKRVGETTQFNGKNLLNASEEIKFQVGANDGENIGVKTIVVYTAISAYLEPATLGARLESSPAKTSLSASEIVGIEKKLAGEVEESKEGKKWTAEEVAEVKTAAEVATKVKEKVTEKLAAAETAALAGTKAKGLEEITKAIEKVSELAGQFGAVQDRIQYSQSNLEVYSQNLTAAVSALNDVNMATEMTNFTKEQVLQQAGVSILAHANQLPAAALKLLE